MHGRCGCCCLCFRSFGPRPWQRLASQDSDSRTAQLQHSDSVEVEESSTGTTDENLELKCDDTVTELGMSPPINNHISLQDPLTVEDVTEL